MLKILTRFSILARLISHISKTNTIQEFNFTLAYLLDDLLPDGEKYWKIRGCCAHVMVPFFFRAPPKAARASRAQEKGDHNMGAEDAGVNSLSRKTSTLKHCYSRDIKIPELTRGVPWHSEMGRSVSQDICNN